MTISTLGQLVDALKKHACLEVDLVRYENVARESSSPYVYSDAYEKADQTRAALAALRETEVGLLP